MVTDVISFPELEVLFGKTRRAVLGLLFTHTGEEYHLRKITRLTGLGIGPVQRELRELVRSGLVVRRRMANLVLFKANERCPVHGEIKSLIIKTFGLADVLRGALKPIAKRIKTAFIFGSFADGSERTESDVDIFIAGDVSSLEVVKRLRGAQEIMMREINSFVCSSDEFFTEREEKGSFIHRIWNGSKIMLAGSEENAAGMG